MRVHRSIRRHSPSPVARRRELTFDYVTASVTHLVPFEMRTIDAPALFRLLTTCWHGALITVLWMEAVIHVAVEPGGAVKPRACANKDATVKPFRTVVPRWGTRVRSHVIVSVGTFRRHSNFDADLSFCHGRETDSRHGS